ncbi:cupin domain-containing protein [Paludibaculum fermentans]|uniref:cupin domain-containing protein n=1 Tax=Paludibaculum fermentans TaxID=1473598 RepID=UPI003EB86AE3
MTISRRNLAILLPALAAKAQTPPAQDPVLPSRVYHSSALPYSGDAKKKGRRFFRGTEHSGFILESHETVLGPGITTHPPHKHEHDEFAIIVEGTAEAHLDGRTETVEAGSVVFFASNRMHNLRNAGEVPCRYYVIELRGKQT